MRFAEWKPLWLGMLIVCAPLAKLSAQSVDKLKDHSNRVQSVVFGYPAQFLAPVNFAVLNPGAVAVPLGGGVMLAGIGGWLVEPPRRPIISIASVDGVHLIAVQAGDTKTDSVKVLRQRSGKRMELVGVLPRGLYNIAAVDSSSAWLWGHSEMGDAWGLWFLHGANPPTLLVRSKTPLLAAAPVGQSGLIAVVDSQLVLIESRGAVTSLGRVREVVDGMAVSPKGVIYMSSPSGIYAMTKPGRLELIAPDVHGPLVYAHRSLFVLSRRHHAVIRISEPGGAL